ncbi:bifunctional aspartate kinase/homoserine dehydrogenase I [Lacinutrix sp. C3R15]|uniref:bifunctional aspartate kinase/homoserine dehydrogenase I n=1 Tax=Flavobacteriaceae TaxID=49546 RepID=UPI001C08B84C|nr:MULTISPECIES: bifunctional aspartate kinase/homoserine dehydrogenase I [Flavobacteriaceae]MBU2939940.1 bifunctional aspartate kinase/homoserine dehydrogenase I [Lacinutrix sp. C3R15]MDO6623257.1 bifunctional aspartate kinase/homoserine dehydrogenase I [Oceanihabitans sp. 1_MG-2023]
MAALKYIEITNFELASGVFQDLKLSYQTFGKPLHEAPIVLVNHALTGNSNVAGEDGWWNKVIGPGKVIDTNIYTVLAFNIPGNGYDGFVIENYKDFVARDIAEIFLVGLKKLKITSLFAIIGGSLGGGIAWEMAVLAPNLATHLIVVATDWKSTDWLIANCQIQEQFLLNSTNPVHDARMHAMLCYRTPKSFKERFKRSRNTELEIFNVESWLLHHGEKLQERFQLSAYKLMNQLLRSIDVTKGRGNYDAVLKNINANISIVGVDSDLFFTAEENRETQKQLALLHPNVTYNEINSDHGHDAFLIEFDQLETIIADIFHPNLKNKKIKILKFGGKSLANNKGLNNAIAIIKDKIKERERIAVVVSARGNATNALEEILKKASKKESYKEAFLAFQEYQKAPLKTIDFSEEFKALEAIFEGVYLLGDYSTKIENQVLAYGEILSAKLITELLKIQKINANATDARVLIKTDANSQPIHSVSKENILAHFKQYNGTTVNVMTGFIASNLENETTTLGRNGSNYSAALLANYLDAEELQNYTHVNGIYTANPDLVPDAKKIKELSFTEANELANFGATILHAKTIIPLLEKNINLRILNTFNLEDEGTLITAKKDSNQATSLSVLDNVALIHLEGRGLLGTVGVDARIFNALSKHNISVSIISQGSSERGIGLIIDADKATKAVTALEQEFENDFQSQDVNNIEVLDDVAVISIIGIALSAFHKPFNALIKNQITPLLFNNTFTGKNVSLVVKKDQLLKAANVIHGEVFYSSKKVNLAVFGHGLVGGALINQIISSAKDIEKRKGVKLNIFAISNSKKVLLSKNGVSQNWQEEIAQNGADYSLQNILDFADKYHLENLIAIDNTASKSFVENYNTLVSHGFDLVSSNKIANTIGLDFYTELRSNLNKYQKKYLYETNVGAGLPLIDTIKLLHLSGENITRIRGVFSGTLSYIFNHFSSEDRLFSDVLREAIEKGFTEPDPREDLCGNDVARKLLILARELDLNNEIEDVVVQNLIPEALQSVAVSEFLNNLEQMNVTYKAFKENQKEHHVLRYIGDLSGNLEDENGAKLEVKLVSVPQSSPLGALKGSDSIFEIYTESYGEQPLVIQGAGAGAQVTARGVFGDILRLVENNN